MDLETGIGVMVKVPLVLRPISVTLAGTPVADELLLNETITPLLGAGTLKNLLIKEVEPPVSLTGFKERPTGNPIKGLVKA